VAAPLDDPIRVALVGYGVAGAVFHGPCIAATPGMVVASIVTSDPDRQARAKRDHPDARIIDGVDALWDRATEHDLVVVAAPNRAHVPIGLRAIEARLAVVVDKPLAVTAADGRRLVSTAAERGVLLTVFHNRRWDGDFLTLQRLLSEGALGPVSRFESRFERWRPAPKPGAWRERGAPEEGGGVLFDLGSHLVDQAVVLFGRPTQVYAELDRRRPGVEVDDDSFLALTHARGIRSHLWMSAAAAALGPRFRVLGLSGAYEKYGMDVQEEALAAGGRPGGPDWGREPPERWGRLLTGESGSRPVATEPGAYQWFYGALAEALRTGGPPPVDPAEAVTVLDVLEAAVESASTGTVVALR
jgi:predicted dehydrogenase